MRAAADARKAQEEAQRRAEAEAEAERAAKEAELQRRLAAISTVPAELATVIPRYADLVSVL